MTYRADVTTLGRWLAVLVLTCSGVFAQSQQPGLNFSDLESGPKTGGQDNKGAFVTIWGANFGATRGSSFVTIGGGAADNYPLWSDTKITFQLGAAAASGVIKVTTSAGTSNGLPFTVRSGNIYFAATNGSDSNNGSFTAPFRSLRACKNQLAAGDICYVRNGVNQTTEETYRAALILGDPGSPATPRALVVYPRETATIGSTSVERAVFLCRDLSACADGNNWVVAGFNIIGGTAALEIQNNYFRAVGNTISCPNGDGASACVEAGYAGYTKLLGNEITNAGTTNASKLYHAVYFTTNHNHVEVGWNWIHNNRACRGVQFHSTSGDNQYDLSVHDNRIHDIRCDGINFATIDPSRGKVEAYNNVIFNAGTGPTFPDGDPNYSCIYVPAVIPENSSGVVEIYNNTLYNCGGGSTTYGGALAISAAAPDLRFRLRNNIISQNNGVSYFGSQSAMNKVSGSNNLWFGRGNGPSQTTGNINQDPQFVNAAGFDFHLKSGSPAINAGTATGLTLDKDGLARPQGSAIDVGAYEFGSGGGAPPPQISCDVNSDGNVNSADVDLAVRQALSTDPCGSSDINQDGACNVVDVQRIVNASLGQSCRTGT